jgi:hypothetical protein
MEADPMKIRFLLAVIALFVLFNGAVAAFVLTASNPAPNTAQTYEMRDGLERLAVSDIKGNGAL